MDAAAIDGLSADFAVRYDRTLVDRPDELRAAVAGVRALIVRNRTQVRGALLGAAGSLEAVGRLGVGLDNIDVDACKARGIAVLPATGANDVSVAEYVVGGLLMLLRGAYFASAAVAAGDWPRERLIGREAAGMTLGLVGFGGIARAVARRAAALEMRLVGHDPYLADDDPAWAGHGTTPVPFDRLLAGADVVSLHVPLTDATRHLIGAAALAAMRDGAVLINAARGGVVDEAALADALRGGTLGGAMLDVFEREPLPAGAGFEDLPNLILTPHIAGVTQQSNVRVSAVVADKVRRILGVRQ
ncbi:MAG: hydroxyacid dehydrogenase [Inquilinus sp.]|nr:hydroxyacid dehydrogenase [Inquilinus sp.]